MAKAGGVEKVISCEILVIGSGVSAYSAAIAAGRAGRSVVLVEKDEVLGGNSGPNLGVHITGADRHHNYGSETGIIAELQEESAWIQAYSVFPTSVNYNISRRWEAVVQTALEEAGVRILKRHYARDPVLRRGRIAAVIAEDMAAFQTVRIDVSGVVIDGSGDGEVAARAGAGFRVGAEAKEETGERSAGDERSPWVQGSSLVVIIHRTDRPVRFVPPPGTPPYVPRVVNSDPATALHHHENRYTPDRDLIFQYMTEYGGKLDTIRDDAAIYEALLKQVWAEWDHIKNGPHAEEARNWDLVWVSPKAGKRESRRFVGAHVLTQTDIEAGRDFPDAVAYGGFDIDRHWHFGEHADIVSVGIPPMYPIPLRSLYSADVKNLFLAGRMISATHLAHASARVMRTGAAIGQAVGEAAAMCVERAATPRQVCGKYAGELRQTLLKNDATILHLLNADPSDIARAARVTASSEATFDDQTPLPSDRGDRGDRGVALDRPRGVFLYGRAEKIERALAHLSSARPDAVEVEMTVAISRHDRKWRTHHEYEEFGWRDGRAEAFQTLGRAKARVEAGAAGWVEFDFGNIALPAKDETSDDDRLLLSIAPAQGVSWSLAEPACEIAARSEMEGGRWRSAEGRHALRLTPAPLYGEAANVVNGFNRRFSSAPVNMWISRPGEALPQWVELDFGGERAIDTVRITFDTLYDNYERMPWNSWLAASEMCVRDYAVEARRGGRWRLVAAVRDNYHRLSVHRPGRFTADALRVVVSAVHNSAKYTARIYEVRAYDSSGGA